MDISFLRSLCPFLRTPAWRATSVERYPAKGNKKYFGFTFADNLTRYLLSHGLLLVDYSLQLVYHWLNMVYYWFTISLLLIDYWFTIR